jgi:hypothetical protein
MGPDMLLDERNGRGWKVGNEIPSTYTSDMLTGCWGENPPKEYLSLGARRKGSSSAKSSHHVSSESIPICSTEVDVGAGRTVVGSVHGVQGERNGKVVRV